MNVALAASLLVQGLALPTSLTPPRRVPDDSARIARHARAAQARFESRRIALLPVHPGLGGSCEQRIGRLCYAPEDRDTPPPPPEPPRIAELRARLIADLTFDARRLPRDEWIVGQLVRYLIEAERFDEAARFAAAECRTARWWCAALEGWALHEAERFDGSESAYARALSSMPLDERCRWEDFTEALDPARASRLRRAPCDDRRRELSRIAWLARPLYSRAGNDLLTEHYARRTIDRVMRDACTPHGLAWGSDMRTLVTRYGWSTSWTRDAARPGESRGAVTGHGRMLGLDFFPLTPALDEPANIGDSSWRFEDRRARSRYAPRWARFLAVPSAQVARFRRGDSTLVAAAFDLKGDTAFRDSVDAALALAPLDSGEIMTVRARTARRGQLVARAPAAALVASIELSDRPRRAAARARRALTFPVGTAFSDLLLFEPPVPATRAVDFDAATSAMLAGDVVKAGTKLGVYWEVYGLGPGDSTAGMLLTLERRRGGTMRRALEFTRLLAPPSPVSIAWPDRVGGGATRSRSIVVDLAGVPPGAYTLHLSASVGDRTLRAGRTVRVAP